MNDRSNLLNEAIIVFHSLGDTIVAYKGGRGFQARTYLSVNESVSFWVRHDGCSEEPRREVSPSGQTIKETYSGGANGTEVVLYTLLYGTHDWPDPWVTTWLEISATDEAWEFFKSHPKQSISG